MQIFKASYTKWCTHSIFVNGDYARHRSSLLGSMDLLVAIRQVCQIKQN